MSKTSGPVVGADIPTGIAIETNPPVAGDWMKIRSGSIGLPSGCCSGGVDAITAPMGQLAATCTNSVAGESYVPGCRTLPRSSSPGVNDMLTYGSGPGGIGGGGLLLAQTLH